MSIEPVDEIRIEADETISRAVASLMAWHHLSKAGTELLEPLGGMSADTFARRMKRGGWTAGEVLALAMIFGLPVGDLFSGSVVPANSQFHTHVRLSRNTCDADDAPQQGSSDAPFSGSDIDAFLDAADDHPLTAVMLPHARAG